MANKFKEVLQGYAGVFRYFVSSNTKPFLKSSLSIPLMILIMGVIGVLRNMLEVWIGGDWAGAWFAFTPDIFFTMFMYPVFICFFMITLIHFLFKLFKINIDIKQLLALFFYFQILHLLIPFFDGLSHWMNIPYHFIIPAKTYAWLIFTPLAWTPLIIFFTWPTSLGIDVMWLVAVFLFWKLFFKHYKVPKKAIIPMLISFYILYMSVYPFYYFFINENIVGSNWVFGLFFFFMSIPSIMYVARGIEKKKTRKS